MKDAAPTPTILLLGGTRSERAAMSAALADDFECLVAGDAEQALEEMAENFVQVAICASCSGETACEETFEAIRARWPETLFVTISEDGVSALGRHIPNLEYVLSRPWTEAELRLATAAACRSFALRRENERLALEMRVRAPARRAEPMQTDGLGFEAILRVPGSPMAAVIDAARHYATFDIPVLLVGEDGTGKATLAEALHRASLRSDKPFHRFDCTGLSDEAITAALFGTARGSGPSSAARAGVIRKADHGSLYLSGVETLSPDMQLRLLRLLRHGTYEQAGSHDVQTSGARFISGATSDLRQMVDCGLYRSDLYFALSVAELNLPTLRDRRVDLPLLARAIAEEMGRVHGKSVRGISDAALSFLAGYSWPGNLRELENELTRMLIHAQEPVLGADLVSRHILQADPTDGIGEEGHEIMTGDRPLKERVEAIEVRILRETLTRLKWNKSRSAAELGLSRVGLRAKLDRYGITQPKPEPQEA